MACKNCGNEIKEGNNFCTRCGAKVKQDNKKQIKFNLKYLIIGVIVIVIICIVVISFKSINNSNKFSNIEETENTEQEEITITQDSDISPTGKEFIGILSDEIKEKYEKGEEVGIKNNIYDTSIKNMRQYNSELWWDYNKSNKDDKLLEEVHYFNILNNKIIASKITVYNKSIYDEILKESNGEKAGYEEHTKRFLKRCLDNYFTNMDTEIYENNISNIENSDLKNIKTENYLANYEIIEKEILFVHSKFNNNIEEVLLLAHNENNNPEDEIKQWYENVSTQNEIIENEPNNILNSIYEKYPNLKNKEGFICTDGTEFWILNNNGEKVYFTDLESFEKAIKETETNINNIEDSNNKETVQENIQNNNLNNIQSEQQQNNESIYINNSMLEEKTENEITNFLEQKELKVKINKKNETIPYPDEKAGKTIATLKGDVGGYHYEKGSTVEVNYTYYEPVEWRINVEMKVSEACFKYNNENCYIYNPTGLYRYCCYNTNPNNLSQNDLLNSQVGRGVKCYINNNYIGDVIVDDVPYTFRNNENLTLKIIAPYIYDFKEKKVSGTNVTVYEQTYNIKELYKNRGSDYIRISLPAMY